MSVFIWYGGLNLVLQAWKSNTLPYMFLKWCLFIHLCVDVVCVDMFMCHSAQMEVREPLSEVGYFLLPSCFGDQTQIVKLEGKCCDLLSHFTGQTHICFWFGLSRQGFSIYDPLNRPALNSCLCLLSILLDGGQEVSHFQFLSLISYFPLSISSNLHCWISPQHPAISFLSWEGVSHSPEAGLAPSG